MKQGTGTHSNAGRKIEPKSHAVSVDRTASIGIQQVRTATPSPLMKGPGFKESGTGAHVSKSGSQGKH